MLFVAYLTVLQNPVAPKETKQNNRVIFGKENFKGRRWKHSINKGKVAFMGDDIYYILKMKMYDSLMSHYNHTQPTQHIKA